MPAKRRAWEQEKVQFVQGTAMRRNVGRGVGDRSGSSLHREFSKQLLSYQNAKRVQATRPSPKKNCGK